MSLISPVLDGCAEFLVAKVQVGCYSRRSLSRRATPKMDLSLQVFAEFKGSLSRPHIVADRIDNLFYLSDSDSASND